jgi:peptide-methionine (R)-S-oxide reductase
MADKIRKSDDEWRRELTPGQYHVLREKGTERPWSGEYVETAEQGVYRCAGCGQELFPSDTKFESHCGWPSFYQPLAGDAVEEHDDRSFGMRRTEVTCSRCGSHLGHVFPDGPRPTGLRYCINSLSLKLDKTRT